MSDFSWETHDGASWEDQPEPEPQAPRPPRRWPLPVGILLLVAVLSGLVYRQLGQRAEVAAEAVTEELLSSHLFVQSLSNPTDVELFAQFLSGRDPDWADAQQLLLARGLFADRPALGLMAVESAPAESRVQEIELSPDLNAAEVIYWRDYAVEVGPAVTATVTLAQTAVYRLGPNRWLYAPPLPEFWGETRSQSGQWLGARYPARDAELVERLFRDLDRKLTQLCGRTDISCRPDFQLQLIFSIAPDSLEADANPVRPGRDGGLILPTPTLVGQPVDHTGYDALYRGYARQAVTAMLSDATGFVCCLRSVLYQALLDELLVQLGLQAQRNIDDIYDTLVVLPAGPGELAPLWTFDDTTANPDDGRYAQALIRFLTGELNIPAGRLAHDLVTADMNGYWDWLLAHSPYPTRQAFTEGWQQYVTRQALMNRSTPPLPWPSQPLELACQDASGAFGIYRYAPDAGSWEMVASIGGWPSLLYPLRGNGRLVVQTAVQDERSQLLYWPDAAAEPALITPGEPHRLLLPLGADPDGRRLLLVTDDITSPSPYRLLDLAACAEGDCQTTGLRGYPLWSPSGEQTLVVLGGALSLPQHRLTGLIFTGDADGTPLEQLRQVAVPFWIDESHFGFASQGPDGSDLFIKPIATAEEATEAKQLIAASQLEERIGSQSLDFLSIEYAAAAPGDDGLIFVVATDLLSSRTNFHLFSIDHQGNQLTTRLRLYVLPIAYRFSPDGRYLAILTINNDDSYSLYLHDVDGNTVRYRVDPASFAMASSWEPAWSADGQWLAQVVNGYLQLIAPAAGYQEVIAPEDGRQCTSVAWGVE